MMRFANKRNIYQFFLDHTGGQKANPKIKTQQRFQEFVINQMQFLNDGSLI